MGRGYGGGARFERSLRVTGAGGAGRTLRRGSEVGGYTVRDGGAGDAEIAWEDATEGEQGRRVR